MDFAWIVNRDCENSLDIKVAESFAPLRLRKKVVRLVNIIENTPVRGYEIFAQEVTSTKQGYYRAWVGLRLPLGEFNKMYNYTISEVVDSYNLKQKAEQAFKETVKEKTVQ